MWEVICFLGLCYCILFGISLKIKDNSIVDVFWGTGFVLIAWIVFLQNNGHNIYSFLFLLALNIWGLRLTYYIGKRKLSSHREDPRYAQWREKWKYFKIRSFFQVYILQGVLMLGISTPVFLVFSRPLELNIYFLGGIICMIIGIIYESVADYQVKKYLAGSPQKNMIFSGGLYKFSRHPNYLGESIFWLGVSITALQFSIFGIIGVLLITFLLLFVSGVPMKEVRYKQKSNWKQYSQKTPKFIPNYFIK